MAKKIGIKERILGSKKARGLIIASVLFLGYVYMEWVSDLTTGESILNSFWVGVAVAFLGTACLVIKEAFDIKGSWTLGFGIVLIGMIIAALITRRLDIVLTLSIPVLIIMALAFFHTKKFGKKGERT